MSNEEKYHALALRYLARRPQSEKEVIDYLRRKNVREEMIQKVILFLKNKKFLNDREFAQWWVDQRTRFKPKGKRLITLELQQKGIGKDIIEDVYHNGDEAIVSDKNKAVSLLEKKKERYLLASPQERYQKLGPYLARRGFDYETIRESIDEVFRK